jgi:hypothetical protein
MKRITFGIFLVAAAGTLAAAQFYRWVDEKGNVEWRDTPPPPHAKNVEERRIGVSTIETSSLPYSVQQAMKHFPVTLWATNCGAPCDQGRALLARRGVPYTEKDPTRDVETFKRLTGGMEVPVLYVGSSSVKGYLDSEWDAALDAAGYPRTAITTYGGKPAGRLPEAPVAKPAAQPAEPTADQPEAQPSGQSERQPAGQNY